MFFGSQQRINLQEHNLNYIRFNSKATATAGELERIFIFNNMNILNLLSSNSYLTVNKKLAREVGLDAAVLFADLASSQLYWQNENKLIGGYFYKTQSDIEEQTTLSIKVQQKCCKILKDKGLLKSKLKGLPAVKHYSIDESCIKNLLNLFGLKEDTSLYKNTKLDCTNQLTINNKIINKKNIEYNIEKEINDAASKYSSDLLDKIQDYFDYRREIKKPFKSQKSVLTKLKEFYSQCDKYGEVAVIESINSAISNGWQGTFIDKKYLTTGKTYGNATEKTREFIQRVGDFEL